MKSRIKATEITIYECVVCGYSGEYENAMKKHEEKHGISRPFKAGDVVKWTETEYGTEQGSPHPSAYGVACRGVIVGERTDKKVYSNATTYTHMLLCENNGGERTWLSAGRLELEGENEETEDD